jgi:hypothetical protein
MVKMVESGFYFGHVDFCCVATDGNNLWAVKSFDPNKVDVWTIQTMGITFKIDRGNMTISRLDDDGQAAETKKIREITDTHMSFEPFKL